MSAITHRASTLTLLRQAEPAFQRTRRGLFDTGSRRFKCLTTAWKTYLRTTFKDGTSDKIIMAAATGGTTTGESTMYLDQVSIETQTGDTTVFTASYKGLITTKEDDVIPSVEMRSLSEVPTGGYVTPVTFMSPVPTVTHLYVSDTRPDVFAVGTAKVPPTFPNSSTLSNYFTAYRADQTALFVGWILKGRVPEQCGGLFQTADTYTYETITAPTQ
jgi:hypothetical protein